MTSEKIDGVSPGTVRRHNRSLVLRRVFEAGTISRTQIASDTGLTGAAISRITRELLDLGLIEERPSVTETGRPGRRCVALSLTRKDAYVIGIGAGAFEQWVRVAAIDGTVFGRRELQLVGLGGDEALAAIVDGINALLDDEALTGAKLLGCGMAVAGVTSPENGIIINSPNFGWRNLSISVPLERALSVPVRIESLHHALNLTEATLGRTATCRNILLVNAALGIGASIVADGQLIRGGRAAAGQIGHMPVRGAGEMCTCGRRGCLDTVASGHAVLTLLGHIPRRDAPARHSPEAVALLRNAIYAAEAGEQAASKAFYTAGTELGKALSAIKMVMDPERIVLAGPLARVDHYVRGLRDALDGSTIGNEPMPTVVINNLTVDAAGAWLAVENFVISDRLDRYNFRTVA